MKHRIGTKALSMLLALVMVVGMIPATAVAAFADGVPEALVTSLTELYDGDEARAREELETLYNAGLIDSDGSLIELDVREDGESVELGEVAQRVAGGETVGELTVNGNAATAEQVAQIQQVSSMLEVIRLIDKDIEITDEHVANLESLIAGIADGSIDLSGVISRGEGQLSAPKRTMRLLGAGNTPALPDNTGSGEVTADADGKYTAPMIDGSTYDASHSFQLIDPDNKTWYTTSSVIDPAVVTLTCAETAGVNSTFTVTATLDAVPSVPVSFDWQAVSGVLNLSNASGTVTWEANDTELEKTFAVRLGGKPSVWVGTQCFVINAGNLKNATFADGATAWSQTVSVSANDGSAVADQYPQQTTNFTGVSSYLETTNYSTNETGYTQNVTVTLPTTGKFRATISYTLYKTSDFDYLVVVSPDVDLNNSANAKEVVFGGYNISSSKYARFDAVETITRDSFPSNKPLSSLMNSSGQVKFLTYTRDYKERLGGVAVSVPVIPTSDQVMSVSVPKGTYYSGQVVPVTVTMKEYAIIQEGATLKVNNVDCPLLNAAKTEAKTFTFGYTVKDTDTGTINVTALNATFKNSDGNTLNIDGNFPVTSFGAEQEVILTSDVKLSGLDWENVEYGIDDTDPGDQTVTVVIPFKNNADKTWIANETIEINPPVSMAVPGYANAEMGAYLKTAYVSSDGGATRYPVYVIGDNADALAVRFAPTQNATAFLRKDTLSFYLDTEVGTTANYLGEWSNKQEDAKGFASFDATSSAAPAVLGKTFSYYVKGCILFDKDATISREGYDAENVMKDGEGNPLGFYKADSLYVAVQGEDASRQHDVELAANEALYKGAVDGIRVEDPNTLVLSYRISGRDPNFTFADPQYFTWTSSNEMVAKVVKDEVTGAGQISLTGSLGDVTITLTVGNGSESKAYDLTFAFSVLEGKTPFLNIPEFSRERVTLTDTDTDMLFASNVTQRNAAVGAKATAFTAKLYKVSAVNETPLSDAVWTESFESTVDNTLTHITVPGTALTEAGIYAVIVSTRYEGGKVDGATTHAQDFTATAYLIVKQAPLKVTLDELESYSADYSDLPVIRYTVTPSSADATVEYAIQKSGEAVGERKTATDGTIPFTPAKPEGLKDAYIITVYARAADAAADDPWSVDSMLLRVYNMDTLGLIIADAVTGEIGGTTGGVGENMDGKTVTMDNHSKLEGYLNASSYQLTVNDLNVLRTDMSLQKLISANYGTGIWGLLSDKIQWESSDPDTVSVNYKQGGIYADIHNYSYTSYGPATDFLLVGKDDTDGVTVTATHAGTGKTASVTVAANTLEDQLYIFQFNPKVETDVIYTNGANDKRTLKSDANGVLAVYEPEGIRSAVMAMSQKDGQTYVGTIFANELVSGERDIASLQLYPTNNLRLRSISGATLTIKKPDGTNYSGSVTLRGGVYKNGTYCPGAQLIVSDTHYDGKEDISATVTDGKLTIGFDPTQFKINPADEGETSAYPTDKITYVVEYRPVGYQASYVMLNVNTDVNGEQKPTDSVIQLREVKGSDGVPQIAHQTMRQYLDGNTPTGYTRNVIDYTENIGISNRFSKAELITDAVLTGEPVGKDEKGYTTVSSEDVAELALYKVDGKLLTGQTTREAGNAVQIIELSQLDGATFFVFPFSSFPMARSVYTMTDANLSADGITDAGQTPTSRVRAMFVRNGMTVTSVTLPFGISNLSHQKDPAAEDAGLKEAATDIQEQLEDQMDIGSIFSGINVNDMLKKGFAFLSGLATSSGDVPFSLIILPTEDPGVFRIVAYVGANQDKNKGNKDGVNLEYDEETMYEDFNSLMEDENDDDDDDDDDDGDEKQKIDSGEGKLDASFSGTLVLEAGYDFNKKEWTINFRGGTVGLGLKAKYEWTQNFVVGPLPVTISFEVGANAKLKVSFASRSSVKLMLVDATVGVYVEAFAGLGFDASIAKLKLGIYGKIGADLNFLLLSDFKSDNPTGTKLDINGEIGIRLEVKVLFINYKKTFASTGFNWSKKWNKYDEIQARWARDGFGELTGLTMSGRAYSMRLLANGTALVTIESGGEIEDRDYLELAERAWTSGAPTGRRLMKAAPMTSALTNVQTNAYPYSNPVFADDGSMFLYISDNNNADEVQSVVSYAVKSGSGYENKGAIDANDAVLADSDVVASGTGSNLFAAWVKQNESPDKEKGDKATYDDLGIMMNATELYAGAYNGTAWTTERLTTNSVADMSPTVASSGDKAIVAWRSLSTTKMPAEGSSDDFTAMFNAENNVNYSIYDGTEWKTAKVAYNGAAGTVNAIDSAMLSDGTSILVYTVRTGEDVTGTETFYTVIDANGDVLTTGRLTNDSYTDTNAQVTAVGDQFVLGWYSEREADETGSSDEPVVAHDIRLARINADGSVDADFPESIGGGSASAITPDFRFSAPANNSELSKLSIVWSQKKDSDKEEDAGKYEINAIRFYESGNTVGVTAQTDIAETAKNTTVDHFDTYTDGNGTVYVLALASDYSSIEGIEAFDQIDLTNLPVTVENGSGEPSSNMLTILEQNPVANMKLGSGTFPETSVEVTAKTNLRELVPGLELPVQFTVKNTGAGAINSVTVKLGSSAEKTVAVSLLPNESTIITEVYPVPEEKIRDVDYTVTADGVEETGTLVLNRPDVGISGMKLLSEQDGMRRVQVTLTNASGIPLRGSGKIVKVGFYKSSDHEENELIGSIIEIKDDTALADIDEGIYSAVQTLDVTDIAALNADGEITDEGIQLFAHAWVEDCNELYQRNNDGSLAFKGLLTKSNGEKITLDTSIEVKTEDESDVYTVNVDARNNSLNEQKLGKPVAILLDDKGQEIAQAPLRDDTLTLGKEERTNLSAVFTPQQLNGKTPQRSTVDYSYKVSFDVNGGSGTIAAIFTDTSGHIVLPESKPTPPTHTPTLYFAGWYTAAEGGDKITEESTFTENSTVYAHYTTHEHNWAGFTADTEDAATIIATCNNELGIEQHGGNASAKMTIAKPTLAAYGGTGSAEATVTNGIEGIPIPTIVYKQGETVLNAAPTDAGTYTANITLSDVNVGSGQTGSVTATVSYTIEKVEIKGILAKLNEYKYDTDTLPTPELIVDSEAAENNLTLVQGDSTKSVEYYYKASAFLKSELEDLGALAEAEGVYTELTATTFEPGTHYVLAVISGNNYSNVYTTQSAFKVTRNGTTVRTAPTAPTVEGDTVTVDEADREKNLEYSLDGTTWLPVELDENGQFKAESENPIEAKVQLREQADGNYGRESAVATSDEENKVTITTFTVTYDANGGINAPEAVKTEDGKTASVSGKANMTRRGYTFKAWNTKADGSGAAYRQGDRLESGMTLYAQWEANTYKVRFSANGGKGTMEELEFTYDAAETLTQNAFARDEYSFLGWSLSANGSVQYQDKQSVKNIAERGIVTLYAVWTKDLHNVSGTIKSPRTEAITLRLVQGNNTFVEPKTVEYTTADTEVGFTLNGVPAGTYNLVATQGEVTMTTAVIITEDHVALELITMPFGNASSVIEVKSIDTPAVVVGGLDTLAEHEEIDSRKVKVTMAIEAQNEAQAGEAGEAIIKESRAQNAAFIDFTVTKTITNNGVEESVEKMTETNNVLELVIPFSFSGKSGVKVYRYHGGVEELKQAKDDEVLDGTYSLDQKAGIIHVYTSKFSTYAITYSNSSGLSYEASVSGEEETISVSANVSGNTATVTAPNDAQIEKIVGQSKETGKVTIDLSSLPESVTAVNLPAKTVKAINEAMEESGKGMTVKLPGSTVTFDPAALASIAEQATGTELKLNVEAIAESKLNAKQKEAIAGLDVQAIYDIYLMTSNSKRVTDFGGGRTTVEVTCKLKDGQQPGGIVTWYVADDGSKENVQTTAAKDAVQFTVEHFSNYVIAYDAERAAACPKDDTCPMSAFTDLNKSSWYHDGVHWALESNVMHGYGNGKFGPGDVTSRAMMAQILWNMEGKPVVNYAMSYTDVDGEAWYAEAVRWATAQGIMTGYGHSKFGPNDDMTREQLVTIMYRYAQMKKADVSISEDTNILSYDDAFDVSEWAIPAMQWAVGDGIVKGTSASTLSPKNNASRSEIATIVMRYCEKNAK
ncbi:MAG: S-layer homology domain-containing protein [Eubacteriales bacterium]